MLQEKRKVLARGVTRQWRWAFALVAGLVTASLLPGMATRAEAQNDFRVIPVPYRGANPDIPHPAYNGHPSTLKAITRGGACGGLADQVYYRWDVDGDGEWDQCLGTNLAPRAFDNAGGSWYRGSRYVLECRTQYADVDPAETTRRLIVAQVEAACTLDGQGEGINSSFGGYQTMIFADVPSGRPAQLVIQVAADDPLYPAPRDYLRTFPYTARPPVADASCNNGTCAETGFPCASSSDCTPDDDDSLAVKRAVSIGDASWALHRKMVRVGDGVNTYHGYVSENAQHRSGSDVYLANSAAYLWGLVQNGHGVAYPQTPGYDGDPPDGPVSFAAANRFLYDNDPYAEDASRCLNYLMSTDYTRVRVHGAGVAASQNDGYDPEANDGKVPIPDTDDDHGYHTGGGECSYVMGHVLGALSTSNALNLIMPVGVSPGRPLKWLVQEMVDAFTYYQIDYQWNNAASAIGGWWYCHGATVDGSAAQWVVIGLEAADLSASKDGVIVPQLVKARTADFVYRSRAPSTGSGVYRNGWDGCYEPHLTGGLIVGHGWLGTNVMAQQDWTADELAAPAFPPYSQITRQQLISAYNQSMGFLTSEWYDYRRDPCHGSWFGYNWSDSGGTTREARFDGEARGASYSIYSIQKGLRTLTPAEQHLKPNAGDPSTWIDWFRDYSYYFINSQLITGDYRDFTCQGARTDSYVYSDRACGWRGIGQYWASPALNSGWGEVLVISETLFDPKPVAAGDAAPRQVLEGCVGDEFGRVTFTHAQSYHLSPTLAIAEYRWLFEADDPVSPDFGGVDWAAIPMNGYSADGKAWRGSNPDAAPVYTYTQEGTYHAALMVVGNHPAEPKSDVFVVTGIRVEGQDPAPPVANAFGPYVIIEGEDLVLQGSAEDPNQACDPGEAVTGGWDLTDDGQADTHLATLAGTVAWADLDALRDAQGDPLARNQPIEITLQVTDTSGLPGSATAQLTIYERDPRPCFTATPLTAGCGDAIRVNAGCSSLVDPRRSITMYEWDWEGPALGDGGFEFHADAIGLDLERRYDDLGSFRITLRVTDSWGNTSMTQQTITMEARRAPQAVPGGPYVVDTWMDGDVRAGTELGLDGSASFDLDAACHDSIVAYEWDLNDDGDYSDATGDRLTVSWATLMPLLVARYGGAENFLANPDVVPPQPTLPVVLRVRDTTGRTGTFRTQLVVWHNGPHARFSVSPRRSACAQAITFDASLSSHGHPDHTIIQYDWDFDVDAAAGNDRAAVVAGFVPQAQGLRPVGAYNEFGTYHPVLRVTDDQGRVDYYWGDDVVVDLGNSPPQVDVGGPYVHAVGANLALDATGTHEPDAACGDSVDSWEWDLNGDGVFGDLNIDSPDPLILWADLAPLLATPGDYPADPNTGRPQITVSLRATDTFGESAVGTATLTIYGRDPVAVAHWSPQPFVPLTGQKQAVVHLDGSGSYHRHPDFQIVSWSWGLRNAAQRIPGEQIDFPVDLSAYEIPPEGLERELVLEVADNTGRINEARFTVVFNYAPSQPPTIRFDVDRRGVFLEQGEGFAVSAAGTTDPDGDWIDVVEWDLDGDGQPDIRNERADTNGDGQINGADADPSLVLTLTWAQMAQYGLQGLGQHSVRLTVTDSTATQATDTVLVTVVEHALVAVAHAVPLQGGCQTTFDFDGSESRHLFPDEEIVSWRWDFQGDGRFVASGEMASHVYGAFGDFTASLRVADLLGHQATTTVSVSTRNGNRPPVPVAGGPYFADSGDNGRQGLDLDASQSEELDVACGDSIVAYRWDLDNAIGADGERTWEVESDSPTAHLDWAAIAGLPQDDPDHRILLEIEDSLGGVSQDTTTLLIADGTPVPSFVIEPDQVGCGVAVSIDGSASYHPVPGARITRYEWDFDYDAQAGFQASDLHVNEVAFAYLFDSMGDRTVALRVLDGNGRTATATRPVSVSGDNLAPVAATNGPVRGTWQAALSLDATASSDPNEACGDSIIRYEWDLDDNGVYELVTADPLLVVPWAQLAAYGFQQADPFTDEPAYPIHLRVVDILEEAGTLDTTLRLYESRPVARATVSPQTARCGETMTFSGATSYNTHPEHGIVTYIWDFDVAEDSDNNGTPDDDVDATGAQVPHSYNRMAGAGVGADFVVAPHVAQLTVVDDEGNSDAANVNATLSFQNFRPEAVAGGPYITTVIHDGGPAPVNLDGSGSSDPNEPCDAVVDYLWDTDNDGLYGSDDLDGAPLCGATDCVGETARIVSADWRIGQTFRIGLVVVDAYGLRSTPSETTLSVRSTVPPALVLVSPRGGEVLRQTAPIQLRVSHPERKLVTLEFYMNDEAAPFALPQGQEAQVWTEADGSFVTVDRTFDTTGWGDGRDTYRLRVVARLAEAPDLSSEALSRSPFTIDNTPPNLVLPPAEQAPTLEQLERAGTPFAFHPQITDNLDADPALEVTPLRATYPLGATGVTFTATDWAGNVTEQVITVTVEDTEPPTLVADDRVTREATSPAGTPVNLQASAWDICDAEPVVTSDAPADGFPVGEHDVTFTAADRSGNDAHGQVVVDITDTTPPRILLPNPPRVNVSQGDPRGVLSQNVNLPVPTLTDNGFAAAALTCAIHVTLNDAQGIPRDTQVACDAALPAGSYFPNGETRARYVATDPRNNVGEAFFTVMVLDDEAPAVIVTAQPTSNEWHETPQTVRFRVADASDANPDVTIWPLPAGMDQAEPGEDGFYTLTYSADGTFDVHIQVRDNDNNESVVILDTFGIDRSAPELQVRQFPTEGVIDGDPDTYPVFFVGEDAAPRFTAADPLSGLRDVRVEILPGDRDGQPVTLLTRHTDLGGTPPSGPRSLANMMCDPAPGVCEGGRINLRVLRPGVQRIVFTAVDAVGQQGNQSVVEVPFRILDLAEAVALVRGRIADYLLAGGLALNVVEPLQIIDAGLAVGQESLRHGYLGGCMLSIEDIIKPATSANMLAAIPQMEENTEILARGAYSDATLYWEEAAVGTGEEQDSANFLRQARDHVAAVPGRYGPSLQSSQNSYFYSRNGAIPFRATNVNTSMAVIDQIIAEMERYMTFQDLPAQRVVSDAHWMMSEDVRWKFRELGQAGALRPRHFIDLLLDLQNLALGLVDAEDDGVWVRNWQWGIGQMIRVVVDLARAEAEYLLGPDHCKIIEAGVEYDDGIGLLEDRDPDGMLAVYARPDITCLMLEIYYHAEWQPAFPPEEHNCEILGCP